MHKREFFCTKDRNDNMKIISGSRFRVLLIIVFALAAALALAFGVGGNGAVHAAAQPVSDGEAFLSALDGGAAEIRLNSDITVARSAEIAAGRNVTIDLNGCNLTVNHVYFNVAAGASLALRDGAGGGSVVSCIPSDVQKSVVSVEGGRFVFESGIIDTSGDTRRGALSVSGGTAEIYGGFAGEFGIQSEENGSVKIYDGAKVYATSYPVRSAGNLEISGGEITSSADYSVAVSVTGGSAVIKGGNITSTYTAVYNFGGELTISGGFFRGGQGGSPIAGEGLTDISGGYFGSGIAQALSGTDYIEYDHSSEEGYAYPDYPFTVRARYIAQIDEDKYGDLADAFAAAEGKTVKLIASAVTEQTYILGGGQVTLDLNGFTLTAERGAAVEIAAGARLTIENSAQNKSGALGGEYGVINGGTLNVAGGIIRGTTAGIRNNQSGELNISGGFVGGAAAIVNIYGGTVAVTGGSFSHTVVDYLAGNTYTIVNHSSEDGYAYPDYPYEVVSSRCLHTDVVTMVVEPTCTTGGYTLHVCNNCGARFTDSAVPATGHTEVIDEAVEATCAAAGLTEGKHCSVCNAVLVAQQPVTKPHTMGDWVIDAYPTATEGGSKHRECAECGASETKSISRMATDGGASVTGTGEGRVEIKVKQTVSSPVVRVNADATALRLAVMDDGDESRILGGRNAEIYLEVSQADGGTLKTDKALISKATDGSAVYFGLSLYKKIGTDDAVSADDYGGGVSVTLTIPDKLGGGKNFKVVRVLGGAAEVLESEYNEERGQLTFTADGFGTTYAIVYTAAPASLLWLWIVLPVLCAAAAGAVVFVLIKRRK